MLHSIMTVSFYIGMLVVIIAAQYAKATPLYITDDAQTTPEKSCQLEVSQFFQASTTNFNINPACTLGTVELSLPVNFDAQQSTSWAAQLKHTLYLSDHFGVAVSGSYQPKQHENVSVWSLNIPFSFYHLYGDTQLDVNLGMAQAHEEKNELVWAVALTKPISTDQRIGLEYFKAATERKRLQAIWSIDLNKDTSIYLSYSQTTRSSFEQWFGLGLSFAV
ncbi:hypothetical protein GCM10027155_07700 [Acinetobacter apis]|uniref:MetA-pathway of phenol degradation n=1 Tax=Acinetobacter apis TaxID=1229165 RepID=A0A217EEA0_9GAMM|nr:hypothetical protein [Acinetobacter apis]SNQ28849.1 hypothetical protein SAMN05444584_0777 [Acinetobacter apis]